MTCVAVIPSCRSETRRWPAQVSGRDVLQWPVWEWTLPRIWCALLYGRIQVGVWAEAILWLQMTRWRHVPVSGTKGNSHMGSSTAAESSAGTTGWNLKANLKTGGLRDTVGLLPHRNRLSAGSASPRLCLQACWPSRMGLTAFRETKDCFKTTSCRRERSARERCSAPRPRPPALAVWLFNSHGTCGQSSRTFQEHLRDVCLYTPLQQQALLLLLLSFFHHQVFQSLYTGSILTDEGCILDDRCTGATPRGLLFEDQFGEAPLGFIWKVFETRKRCRFCLLATMSKCFSHERLASFWN